MHHFDICFESLDQELQNNAKINATLPIYSLPCEILASILSRLPPGENRNELRRVSQWFKKVMDKSVGTTTRIGTFSQFDPMKTDREDDVPVYHSPSIITRIGIDQLIVGNISGNWKNDHSWFGWVHNLWNHIRSTKLSPTPLPSFLSPSLVTSLDLLGNIVPTHLSHFLNELPLLKVFIIGFYSLENLESSHLENLSIPNLEILVIRKGISYHPFRPTVVDQFVEMLDLEKILINLLTFLNRNHFPKLEKACIDMIYGFHHGLEIIKTLLEFLHIHSSTIKSFQLEYSGLINNEFRLIHAPENHPGLLDTVNSLEQSLKLKELRILPLCLPKLPYQSAWKKIVEAQLSLTEFAVTGVCYQQEFLQQVIQVNYNTLKTLFVWEVKLFDTETNSVKPLDCGIFHECHKLSSLSLRGWTITLTVNSLINVDQLPNVENIELSDMSISSENIRKIALELPSLKSLTLEYVGSKGDMGMDISTLKQVILQRRLKRVQIYKSLNGKIENGISNEDLTEPENIEEHFGLICFQIGQNGYYVTCDKIDSL